VVRIPDAVDGFPLDLDEKNPRRQTLLDLNAM
jgi:hypothetical protein